MVNLFIIFLMFYGIQIIIAVLRLLICTAEEDTSYKNTKNFLLWLIPAYPLVSLFKLIVAKAKSLDEQYDEE